MTLASTTALLPARPLSRLALLAVAGSSLLLLGALAFQFIGGLPPCELCHWQRYVHIGVVVLGLATLASASRPDLQAALLGLTIAALVGSAGLAGYHAAIEWGWIAGPQSCTGDAPRGMSAAELRRWLMERPPVRCDVVPWSLLGLSMAGWNFAFSLALAAVLAFRALRRDTSA